jgi:hypothetical protein
MLKNAKFATNLTLIAVHWKHPPSPDRGLMDVSREFLDIYIRSTTEFMTCGLFSLSLANTSPPAPCITIPIQHEA